MPHTTPTTPTTVAQYLKSLPPDRRTALQAIRETIRANIGPGLKEGIQYGMIGYFVPHSVYPPGYHCNPSEPLPFAGIASQKNHMALHLFCIYTNPSERERFVAEWKKTGKKLDMGASCVRFKKLDDVPLEVVGRAIKRITLKKFIAAYESAIPASKRKPPTKKQAAKKTTKKVAKKKTAKRITKRSTKKATSMKTSIRRTTKRPAGRKTTKKYTSR